MRRPHREASEPGTQNASLLSTQGERVGDFGRREGTGHRTLHCFSELRALGYDFGNVSQQNRYEQGPPLIQGRAGFKESGKTASGPQTAYVLTLKKRKRKENLTHTQAQAPGALGGASFASPSGDQPALPRFRLRSPAVGAHVDFCHVEKVSYCPAGGG